MICFVYVTIELTTQPTIKYDIDHSKNQDDMIYSTVFSTELLSYIAVPQVYQWWSRSWWQEVKNPFNQTAAFPNLVKPVSVSDIVCIVHRHTQTQDIDMPQSVIVSDCC